MANPIEFNPNISSGVPPTGRPAVDKSSNAGKAAVPAKPQGPDFQKVLQGRVDGGSALKFSSHALARLRARGIVIGPELMAKLQNAVGKAAAKGSRDALLVTDKMALIVSIKNRTVITALDGASMKENVFTNIDSAVLI